MGWRKRETKLGGLMILMKRKTREIWREEQERRRELGIEWDFLGRVRKRKKLMLLWINKRKLNLRVVLEGILRIQMKIEAIA